jgi:hypothetical protein
MHDVLGAPINPEALAAPDPPRTYLRRIIAEAVPYEDASPTTQPMCDIPLTLEQVHLLTAMVNEPVRYQVVTRRLREPKSRLPPLDEDISDIGRSRLWKWVHGR